MGFMSLGGLVFITIFVFIIVIAVKGIIQWDKNNNSPRLTVEAVIVAKRVDVSHHQHGNAGDIHSQHSYSSTHYYITFQVASGDRMEFSIKSQEYGFLVEGDVGMLSFQGTRYLSFQRHVTSNMNHDYR